MKARYCVIILAVWSAIFTGCSVNPATGQRQFNMYSDREAEIALGAKSAPEFLKSYGGPIPDPEIRGYVDDLGQKLAAQSERPDLPWHFTVVDSALLNAFALPGGQVFVSRALLGKLSTEAQLAGVLGHEIGHVTAQHHGQQRTRATVMQVIGVGVAVVGEESDQEWVKILGVGTTVGGTLYLLSYGRNQETQSDELGLRYMTRLNYTPMAMREVMQVFQDEAGKGGAARITWLSTHPLPQQRVKAVQELILKRYPDYKTPDKYNANAASYKNTVLDRLAKLPPAKHDPAKDKPKAKEQSK
jgi:predicted Zn-dependent protease